MSATTNVTTYTSPIKFDLEIVAGAVIAGIILGIVDKIFGGNKILKLIVGAVMFLYGPVTAYGSFIKLAGLTMIADVAYDILKQNVTISVS